MQSPDHFAFYAARFGDDRIQSLLNEEADETCQWARKNKTSINAKGEEILRPWLDEQGFSATPANELIEEARHDTLASQVHEQGIAKLLEIATRDNVLDVDTYDDLNWLVFARSGEVKGWIHVLVRYSWIERPMNLGHFRDTGDFHPGCPQAHAKAKLMRLARLGFVTVTKPQKEFVIRAGPVAKTFYEKVWFPLKKELSQKIGKCEGGQK